jgi:hypothetical protein
MNNDQQICEWNADRQFCRCSQPKRWISDPYVPIVFDKQMNEFHLRHGLSGNDYFVLYYCFFCGGKLPESKRGMNYVEPDMEEVGVIAEVMSRADNSQIMRAILGEPDRTDLIKDDSNIKASYTYTSKWQTLDLIVREYTDGHISYSVHPKSVS